MTTGLFSDKNLIALLSVMVLCFAVSCRKQDFNEILPGDDEEVLKKSKPNIILILADDVGYEVPTNNGGESYSTPNIDKLAANGMRFRQCHVCPNCAPTRIELLTGKYGFRNYTQWGHLDTMQRTFVNVLRDAGYKTCVAGKWQLDGGDASIKKFGFDKYRVFQPFYTEAEGQENKYRYKNPKLYEKGAYLSSNLTNGKYADDMFADYISKFIDSNLSNPFFIYFPLSLCHAPFSPTPDDPEFAAWNPLVNKSDSTFYPSMVKYMDKKVKQVKEKIAAAGLSRKTIIIFMGDNGCPSQVVSVFNGDTIVGGKSTPTVYGTHVPLSVTWQGNITPGQTSAGLVDASDLFPTILKMAKLKAPQTYQPLDGINFYPLLFGSTQRLRDWIYCWWNPQNAQPIFRVWTQDENYKLYDETNNGYFFDILNDPLELNHIPYNELTTYETSRKNTFDSVLNALHN